MKLKNISLHSEVAKPLFALGVCKILKRHFEQSEESISKSFLG